MDCGHDPWACLCASKPLPAQESLDELQFSRSACNFAQLGAADKLERLLLRRPEVVHGDGASNTSGYTPLHYASRAGKVPCLKLLLKHGAIVDARTRRGAATPLHRAAHAGQLEAVQVLLAAGADATLQDADGETPLHKAASQGHVAVAGALLQAAPAAADLRDRRGLTPRQRAVGAAVGQVNWGAVSSFR